MLTVVVMLRDDIAIEIDRNESRTTFEASSLNMDCALQQVESSLLEQFRNLFTQTRNNPVRPGLQQMVVVQIQNGRSIQD